MEIENIWVVVCKECGKIYKYDNKTQLFLDDIKVNFFFLY